MHRFRLQVWYDKETTFPMNCHGREGVKEGEEKGREGRERVKGGRRGKWEAEGKEGVVLRNDLLLT